MSLRVPAYPTSWAYSRDLFPPGNALVTESGGGTKDANQVGARLGAHFARGCSVVLGSARFYSVLTWAY